MDNCCLRIINKPKRYISNATLELAKRAGKGILNNLFDQKQLKIWQLTRIEELTRNLNDIARRKPVDAVKYIRHIVGYNEYLDEYRQYRKIGLSGLIEVLDELQEAASQFQKNEEFAAHMENVVAAARNRDKDSRTDNDKESPGVLLSTMHSAKGLEFDTVFIAGAVEGNNPHERSKTNPELEEERRLFYVGLTRAKKHLYVSIIKKRHEANVKPTRFLDGLLTK
jgi:DNA helicase-2/ATP-dependent DNA helicase PcrA